MVLNWLVLAVYVLLAGGVFLEAYSGGITRAAAARMAGETARLRWLSWCLIAAFLITAFALIGRDPREFADNRWTILTFARLGLLIGLLALLRARKQGGWLAVLAALALLATQSLLSRSARLAEPILPVFTDWLHLTLAAAWIGGVAWLAVVAIALARAPEAASQKAFSALIDRFSPYAMFCVAGLAIGGVAQAGHFIDSIDDLFATAYGRALSAKLALFAILLAFGAFHQFVVAPKLRNWALLGAKSRVEPDAEVRRWRVTLLAETGTAALLIAAVAAMKMIAPA
jgi:putative copper export protein